MLNEIYQSLDPVAFSIGPLTVRWYGIAYILGFICAGIIMVKLARKWDVRIDDDAFLTIILCVIIGVILGARLGYVLFYGNGYYLEHPDKIFAINEGGMSFHGGFIGCLIGGAVAAKITHIPFLTLADLGACGAPAGLFFGRCANFINGELWGAPTDLPWGVVFGGAAGDIPRHPSQLYEALLEGVVLLIVLLVLARKKPARPRGTFLGVFLLLYGCFRFLVEFIRQPDAQLGYLWGGWLTMGQVLSVPLVIAGICLLVYAHRMKLPQQGLPKMA
jgi:phosphatidylglycerol:prolipoprotein diacylglycerol transferase